ncbi:putative addiction module antidote protein [Mesorhizobium sp. NBSH29]|uniref:addiction module antidote protein n=1 Tax=Mesorhizobium sp. NBSH29 TaxID=2654249 RepID=UPI0018965E39|nr:addiction module antidote protein [Mesorhizobium sp. NBSH29]QPC87981.1 putative addiction module antidote protein [Mesorhizobium sp. NBSH29]
MAIETHKWDVTEYLDNEEAIFAYIEAAFEDGDPVLIKKALGEVARARGMTAMAKESGVTREALYKALSENGDPKLSTLLGVAKALGVRLTIAPAATVSDYAEPRHGA